MKTTTMAHDHGVTAPTGEGAAVSSSSPPEGGATMSTTTTTVSPTAPSSIHDVSGSSSHEILMVHHDDETLGQDDGNNIDSDGRVRVGNIASARFNILSTMVGGGCLSLPLAFQQSGNALTGPLMLIVTGLITDFCFRLLVASSVALSPPNLVTPGKESFESITSAAFGPKAYIMSMGLVTLMCFFGAVGYSVLLRDMMEPLNDFWVHGDTTQWLYKNLTMFVVILVVTPACTLTNFTALKNCGAASMLSILILGSCIVVRSVQCNCNSNVADATAASGEPWYSYLTLWPESPRELLDAVPLYISCFVCHYNILPVHNELRQPTPVRVSWWLRSTTWYAVGLYMIMGFAGSTYGHCTATGKVQGNILLDFDEHDHLLLVGRMCLALTITLAFPMLVIPARDILLRSIILPCLERRRQQRQPQPNVMVSTENGVTTTTIILDETITEQQLHEPLLTDEERQNDNVDDDDASNHEETLSASFLVRLLTSMAIFWMAGGLASCVESIDIVWDLLGSSLSILLSYLIPCGSYLVIMKNNPDVFWSKLLCWLLLLLFVPLMIISTANAIINTFFSSKA